jgi:hypothetical protein
MAGSTIIRLFFSRMIGHPLRFGPYVIIREIVLGGAVIATGDDEPIVVNEASHPAIATNNVADIFPRITTWRG